MEPNNIFKSDFLDILFEGRNQKYGAYVLRKEYPKRLLKAIVVSIVVAVLLMSFSTFIKEKKKETAKLLIPETQLNTAEETPKPKEKVEEIPVEKENVQNNAVTKVPTVNIIHYTPPSFTTDIADVVDIDLSNEDAVSGPGKQNGKPAGINEEIILNDVFDDGPITVGDEKEKDINEIYTTVEVEAYYDGNWRKFLERNFNMPQDAIDDGVQGDVIMLFIVEKDGSVNDVKVSETSPNKHPKLIEEAKRIIQKSGKEKKWNPGIQNGNPVRSYHEQKFSIFIVTDGE